MTYKIEFKPRAFKDLQSMPKVMAQRVMEKIELMREDLRSDVKRLTDHAPEYRLRVGDYRVLFEVDADKITIYRVKHRSDAYGA